MTRKVVITGLGATTPIGGDVPTMWQNALKGVSGAHTLEDDWVAKYELPVHFAARCSTPALDVLSRVEAKRMDPSTQFGVIAHAKHGPTPASPKSTTTGWPWPSPPASAVSGRSWMRGTR
jgi:3-oxoacyl-(acyl-carrier-protein) synthase